MIMSADILTLCPGNIDDFIDSMDMLNKCLTPYKTITLNHFSYPG